MEYLLSCVNTYRVHTVEDAKSLHARLKEDGRFAVVSFSYTTKYIKEKKEIVDQYQVCKAKLVFTEEKDPDRFFDAEYEELM